MDSGGSVKRDAGPLTTHSDATLSSRTIKAMCKPAPFREATQLQPQPSMPMCIPACRQQSPPALESNPLMDGDTLSMETHTVRTHNRRHSHSFNSSANMDFNVRSRAPSPSSSGHADSESREYEPFLNGHATGIIARGLKIAVRRRERSFSGHETAVHPAPNHTSDSLKRHTGIPQEGAFQTVMIQHCTGSKF